MSKLSKYIVGDSTFTSEHQALNIVLFVSTLFSLLYLPLLWIQNIHIGIFITTIITLITLGFFYYLSRFRQIFTSLILPFKFCVLLLITGFWFNTGGINGTGIGLFPSAVIGFIIISPKPNYIRVILALSLFFMLLIIGDIYLSDWLTPYNSIQSRYIDLSIGVVMSISIIGLSYGMLKTKFRTEQEKVFEKNIELEQANLLKSQFISNINHELRTPMNGIVGMLSLLEQTPTNIEQQEYIQAIQLSGERLLNIVNEILDFSNISTNASKITPSVFSIQDLVEHTMAINAHEATQKELYFLYDIDPNLSNYEWKGDLEKIQHILSNLINNAIKFTPSGEVIIEIIQKEANWITFNISDTGIGILPDKIDSLFNPFTQLDSSSTRQFGGTGLGLAISKKNVDLLGGTINVTSQIGKGSTFSFSIPLQKEAIGSVSKRFSNFKNKTALLVSPHPILAKIIKNWLSYKGMQVHCIEEFKNLSSSIIKYQADLVLLDCKTPRLKHEELNAFSSNIPFILIQNSKQELSKKNAEFYSSCILTPLRREKLYMCIQNILVNKTASIDNLKTSLQDTKILVVDDDKINRKLLERMLLKSGYTVDSAVNGQEAVDKTMQTHYNVILMDLQMPVMDGFDASRQIIEYYTNNRHNNCPKIVAITANILNSDKIRCFEIGMDHYLTKPITSNDLQKLFHKFKF